jgi:uncharacterized protein
MGSVKEDLMMNRWVLVFACLVLMVASAAVRGAENPKVLIITGNHGYHDWKATTPFLKDVLSKAGLDASVTETPAKDLTSENLAKYDAMLLNYRDQPEGLEATRWSAENKKAFADAVRGGKGLVVYHFASSAFTGGDAWSKEYETVIAGGWRKQGHHGKRHEFDVTVKDVDHPITRGIGGTYHHNNDELYQNSLVPEGATLLVTAWSDKKKDPKNTDKDEPMVWVTKVGEGRVVNNVLGHDVAAMDDPIFKTLIVRCVEWAATGETKSGAAEGLKKVEK